MDFKVLSNKTQARLNRKGLYKTTSDGQWCNKNKTVYLYTFIDKPVFAISISSLRFTLKEYFQEVKACEEKIIEIANVIKNEYEKN